MPFRDSMLTMMLRDSLESACVTRVLACLNPGVETFAETRNVLIYVHRASSVDDDEPEEVVLKTYDDIQRMQRAGKVRGALNAPTAQQLFPQVPWVTARLRMQ